MTPEEIFREMTAGFSDSGKTECEVLRDFIKDLQRSEVYAHGSIRYESVVLLSSSLQELKATVDSAIKRLDELRHGSVDGIAQLKSDVQNFIAAMDEFTGRPNDAATRNEIACVARDYLNLFNQTMDRL